MTEKNKYLEHNLPIFTQMFQGSKQLQVALFGKEVPTILYECGCQRSFPIHDLLYCQQCQKVKCAFCIKEEIDSHYCPNCLDNMTSYDALLFKNRFVSSFPLKYLIEIVFRCKKCFECPSCFASLSFVQSTGKSDDSSEEPKSSVYLHCSFCRWDSLAIGLQAETPNTLIGILFLI